MACQYFVNGEWISEEQFKEVLNNGLLDNLVANGTVKEEGFPVDNTKLLKTETVTTTKTTVPVEKLAAILAKEVSTRSGYPLNMLSALELKEDKSDFKIPLWASPYASKFESLLTSLVSNKVVKQKFAGTSSVLGSEEGFRIKQGDEAAGSLKDSSIVFSDNFDPEKGLQPMRVDPKTGKILPAQIMLPFKFRDESGNILFINDFLKLDSSGRPLRTPDGRVTIDDSKLPAKLRQLFGFRIPTQERNSMAAVEIVGFLPEAMGDLVLAPRDFTKQMGSDFDVDKLYSYLYNHFYKDGKLYTNFPSDKKTIKKLTDAAKEHLATLKSSLKLNSAEQALLNAYIDNKLEKNDDNDQDELLTKATTLIARLTNSPIMEEIENVTNDLSIYNRAYKASRQNKILDIHLSVMLSNNPEVIKSIIALDSFGDFEQLAQDLYKVRSERGLIPPITTILSDTYQRTKYINATAGKTGVGSFSLDSTFNASAQGKELTIINMDDETQTNVFGTPIEPKNPTAAEVLEANMTVAAFGTNVSKGDLSDKYTLRSRNLINKAKEEGRELTEEEKDSLKMKSTIIRSLQSTAVDNEKAQILDKLNINDQTMDAVRALTILGFEEKEIVGLITQEIIWEFTAALKDNGSSLTPFQANAAETLFIDLVKKYDPEGKLAELKPYELEALQSATSESLMSDINTQTLQELSVGPTPDANLRQLAALAKFLKLTQIGKDIKTLQSTINTDSKGVPKSLVETDAKVKQIERLAASNIFNATKLLGEYEGSKLVTPTTLNGFASKYGTMFADTIYKQYFPYHTTGFKVLVDELLQYIPKGKNASLTKQAELQLELMDAVKSFLYGNANTNLFTENPDSERARLFIDTKTNKSLATILQSVSEEKWYTSNGFLNKLSLDQQKNGQVSRVNFESASGENLDERDIYDGFNYLLSKNFPIGTFNGIDYTSRMLAQDLVASAFLEGGQQGSKQYLKYVPTAYLKTIGFGDYLSNTSFNYLDTFLGNLSPEGQLMYNNPSSFMRQYFQNNADKAKKVSLSDLQGKISAVPEGYFTLNEEALKDNIVEITDPYTGEPTTTQTKFLSIYDSKVPGKYALFEFDAVDRLYRRIPTLQGSFGFVSYNSQVGTPLPIEKANRTVKQEGNQEIPGYTLPHTPTTPTKSFDVNVVNNTVKPVTANTLPISKTLSGTKEALDDLINNIQFEDGVSSLNRQLLSSLRDLQLPDNFKVVYDDTLSSRGGYSYDKQILFINLKHEANQNIDGLATAVAHELIHALTSEAIYEYQKGDLSKLTADQIKAIESLKALQDKYIDHLKTKGEAGALQAFKDKYEAWVARGKTGKVGVSAEDISKFYAGIKLSEFVTMTLSDPGFQQHLASVIDESGKSLWEQIKEVLGELLNTLGLDIKPGSALASAVKSSMDLITANQQAMGTKLFVTKIDQFNYSYDAVNNVVIHNAKTGDKVETNDTQINKVLVQYALANNKEQRVFNGSTYVAIADRILNIKNANEVSLETWESAKSTKPSTSIKPTIDTSREWKGDLESRPVYTSEGVNTMRTTSAKADEHFGNPFSEAGYGNTIKVASIGAAVRMYKDWLLNNAVTESEIVKGNVSDLAKFDNQRAWILNQINQGKLDGATLLYAGKSEARGQGMHPTALAEVVEQLRSKSTQPSTQQQTPVSEVKEGVQEIFESNPELANIGTPEQYSQYLDTIFPDSKVKDILYHGTASPNTIEKLQPQNDRIYFSDNLTAARYASWDQDNRVQFEPGSQTKLQVIPAIINLTNPVKLSDVNFKETETNKEGDGIIGTNIEDPLGGRENQIVVRNADQVYELGTKQDLEGFKKFIAKDTKYELFPGVYANQGQTEALDKLTDFLSSDKQAFLLQGKGGTGKTTIIKKIVKEAQAQGNSVLAIAPTHKAKKVLAKSLNDPGIKSTTLAAALAIKLDETTGKFTPDEFARKMDKVPITKTSLVIIDESSMISDKLLEEIKELLPKGTKIIFMGDKAQLPPVGQEKDSAVFDVKNNYTLTEKMRQAATSPIINIGTKVAQNVETTGQRVANPITKEDRVNAFDEVSGSSIIWEDSENKALDTFVEDIKNANGNVDFAKVITFNNQNHNSPQSVKSLNTKIRLKLYGEQANQQQFIPGEILTAYDTFGGEDILFYNSEDLIVKEATEPARKTISVNVTSRQQGNRSKSFEFNIINLTLKNEEGKDITVPIIAESSKEEYQRTLSQLFKTDKQMGYALSSKFGNLEYGYAITSHKAQGSTYTNVYVMEDNIMGSSNGGSMKAKSQSLYVAVSRPTTKLVMVSQKNNQNITEGTFSMSNLGDIDLGNYTDKDNAYNNDDYEAYSREMYNNDQDQLLAESPISRDRLENYLLLCK
jgi:hypothetical protein